jgi:long-subunit fatty acid transport protein
MTGHCAQPEGVVSASGIGKSLPDFATPAPLPHFAQPLGGNGGDAWRLESRAGRLLRCCRSARSFAVRLGVNAPFGSQARLRGRLASAASRALHNEITTLNFNPSVAWRHNERISIWRRHRLPAAGCRADERRQLLRLSSRKGVQQLVLAGQLPPATGNAVHRGECSAIRSRTRARR